MRTPITPDVVNDPSHPAYHKTKSYRDHTAGLTPTFCCTAQYIKPYNSNLGHCGYTGGPPRDGMAALVDAARANAIFGPPPRDPRRMHAALKSATFMIRMWSANHWPFLRSFVVPSLEREGCLFEVCRGKDSFEQTFPDFKWMNQENPVQMFEVHCDVHKRCWTCLLFEM